jgi:CheY-like chemotaxis protein
MTPEVPAILVVDGDDDNRYTLTSRLRRDGYDRVMVATSGPEALDRLAKEFFDLVLLDIMMPEMDGYEVLERIKSDRAQNSEQSDDIAALAIMRTG